MTVSPPYIVDCAPRTDVLNYLNSVTVLAALLHDIGKASVAFQRKLKRGIPQADPVRHELLSVYLLVAIIDRGVPDLRSRSKADISVLDLVASPRFFDILQACLQDHSVGDLIGTTVRQRRILMPRAKIHGRVFTDLCQLILVHHRLATCDADSALTLTPWPYLRDGMSCHLGEVLAGCVFAGGLSGFGDAHEVVAWREAVSATGRSLAASLVDGRPPVLAPGIVQHHGRLALMFGDHHASAVGTAAARSRPVRGRLYANAPSHGAPGEIGQSLARHLVSVARASGVAAHALNRRRDAFPRLSGDQIPAAIAVPARGGRYGWQGDAVSAVRRSRESGVRRGFVAFVMASTGSGKTRAVPSVLLAARPDAGLRYSVGLGLCSLTLQTAREYTARLGFPSDGVAVAIGSSLARKLDRLKRRLDACQAEPDEGDDLQIPEGEVVGAETDLPGLALGADAEFEELGIVEALVGDPPVRELPAIARRMNDARVSAPDRRLAAARTFLAAPILVSTLDQLMPVATSTRGGHLTAALRTATADLVIDELDDFAPEEVCAICRLVEHAASHGRHVVVSTATLPPAVAAAVQESYSSGWARHAALTGSPSAIDVAWLSDVPGVCRVQVLKAGSFEADHGLVARAVADHALSRPWKRRLGYLPCSKDAGVTGYHAVLRGGIQQLHRHHHVVDARTGCRVSAGVVRMANVRPTMAFAAALIEDGLEGVEVLVVPYVGTLLPAVRFQVEQVLDRLLARAGEADPIVSDRSILRPHLDAARSRDLIVVVVTTSLEETGRDHDFDWALSEPHSARGLVQLAGRVRRHRGGPAAGAEPNILLPELCYRAVESPSQPRPFSMPGVETPWRNAHGIETGTGVLACHQASALFWGERWEERITAAPLIAAEAPVSVLAGYERQRWDTVLFDPGDGLGPLRHRDNEFLGNAHQRWRRFRRQHGVAMDLSLRGGRWFLVTATGIPVPVGDRVDLVPLRGGRRLLVPVSDTAEVERIAEDLIGQMSTQDLATRNELLTITLSGRADNANWRMQWHPALGSALRIA